MRTSQWNRRDVVAGLILSCSGILVALQSLTYRIGTASRMEAGYFPFILGILLFLFGLGVAFVDSRRPFRQEGTSDGRPLRDAFRPLVVLSLAVVAFALLIERFGLGPAVFVSVFVSTLADRSLGLLKALVISGVITVICVVIFRFGLGLQVRVVAW